MMSHDGKFTFGEGEETRKARRKPRLNRPGRKRPGHRYTLKGQPFLRER